MRKVAKAARCAVVNRQPPAPPAGSCFPTSSSASIFPRLRIGLPLGFKARREVGQAHIFHAIDITAEG